MGVVGARCLSVCVVILLSLSGCLGGGPAGRQGPIAPEWQFVDETELTPADRSASEVAIAADPTDARHLVAAANSQGGFDLYETHDAGVQWTAMHFPATRVDPTAARLRSLSDPVVAFGPDGTLFVAGLAYLPSSAVFVAQSASGNVSDLEAIRIVHESDLASSFNDKEWIAVDPQTGTLLVAWQKEPAMDQLRGVENALGLGVDLDIGDIVVSRSTDAGDTWSEPGKVSRGMHNNGTQVVWGADGRAHLLWLNYEEMTLDHTASEDGGVTWAEPVAVTDVVIVPAFPRYARMHTLPAFVAAPDGPGLYAVWHDRRDGDADVYAVASPDGGLTWGPATRVNQDTVENGAIQVYPWAAVDPWGGLHVTFYDSRDDAHPRFVFRHAHAAGPALRFNETGNVSREPFTAFVAPDGAADESRSFGDYTGLAASTAGVFPIWADGRGERTAVYAARISLQA